MRDETIDIAERYQGIPGVALGGYIGGLLAGENAAGEVVLRRRVPVGRPVRLARAEDGAATLSEGAETLAEWKPAPLAIDIPVTVTLDEARAAESRSLQRSPTHESPFPRCMTCGDARAPGDGLRVFSGPVAGKPVVAAPWTPDPAHASADGIVLPALTWAVLDCPTIMALIFASPPDSSETVVTARFAVARLGLVRAGEPHVVIGWNAGRDGKWYVAHGAVLSASGDVRVIARHRLATVSWGVPLGVNGWKRSRSAP